MTMDSQWIGRRGETRFDVLCSDANVTVNSSTWDDYGWDKLVEYPPRAVPFAAIDMQPGHVVAAIQVKTTETAARSVSISLSNALRYAKASIPQFILLIALDGPEPCFFVRHVWGPLIADWLKAGRQADADGVEATHLKTVSLNFAPENEMSATDVLSWIRNAIEAVPPAYAAAKKLFVDTVGFENGGGFAQMTFSLENADEFLDVQLGLRPHLDVKRFVYTSERFGIRAGKPEVDEENVRIHLTPEGRSCALRLEFSHLGSMTVPATLYEADGNGKFAMRVASRVLDLTIGSHHRVRAHAQLERDDRVTLNELCAYAHLLASKGGNRVALDMDVDGKVFDLGSIAMKGPSKGEQWLWAALGLGVMRAIANDSGQAAADLTLDEVDAAAGQLEILSALATHRAIRVDFTPEPHAPAKFGGFLAYSNVVIGEQVYSAVAFRPIGKDTRRGDRRRVFFAPGRLVWGRIAPKEGWDDTAVRAAYQRQLDLLSVNADIMAVGDLQKMVHEGRGDHVLKSDLPTGREALSLRSARKTTSKRRT